MPVLLHVGLGTFRPVKAEKLSEHKMHSEYYCVSAEAAEEINCARQAGGRVFAVGTTSTRVLETVAVLTERWCPAGGGRIFLSIRAIVSNAWISRSRIFICRNQPY